MEQGTRQLTHVRTHAVGVLMAGLVALSACSEQNPEYTTAPEGPDSRMAELHNLALGAVLSDLQQRADTPAFATPAQLRDYSMGSIRRFLAGRGIPEVTDREIDRTMTEVRQYLTRFETVQSGLSAAAVDPGEIEDPFITRILSLVRSTTDPERLARELPAIEADAVNALSGDDLTRVLDASAVALASARYWNENFTEWVQAICDNLEGCEGQPSTAGIFALPLIQYSDGCWDDVGEAGWTILGADIVGGIFGLVAGAAGASTAAAVSEGVDAAYNGCD